MGKRYHRMNRSGRSAGGQWPQAGSWIPRLEPLESRLLLSFTPIATPVPPYNLATTDMAASIPGDGTTLTTLTNGTETLTFSATLAAATVPGSWTTWNVPLVVESSTPRVLKDNSGTLTSLTVVLSSPASVFGFEAEPTNFGAYTMTATFMDGATTVGTISRSVNGNAGALLFAGATDQEFTSVVITAPVGAAGFAIAQPRYLLANPIVYLTGDSLDNQFLVKNDGSGFVDFYKDGVLQTHQLATTIRGVFVSGLGGNDTLTVDSGNGLVTLAPDAQGIQFDGGAGFNQLKLIQTGGAAQTSDTYSVGPNPGEGTSVIVGAGGTQTVFFQNLAPVVDTVAATTLTINGTPAANAISYTQGSVATNGLVTIDNFESMEFSNKTNLVINGLGGSDEISLNNPVTPTGLTLIGVSGGDPTGSDTLLLNGAAGINDINFAPTASDAATITGAGPVPISASGIEHAHINFLAGGITLTVTTPAGLDWIDFTPGTPADTGTVAIRRNASTALLGVSFSNLPGFFFGTGLIFADAGGVRSDTLVYHAPDLTPGGDMFEVSGSTDTIELAPASGGASLAPKVTTTGIDALVLGGSGRNDFFNIFGALPYSSLFIDGAAGSDRVLLQATPTGPIQVSYSQNTIYGLGTPVFYSSLESLELQAGGQTLTVSGNGVMTYTPTRVDGGQVDVEGQPLELTFRGVVGAFTMGTAYVQPGDELRVLGTVGDDTVTTTATTITVNGNQPVTVGFGFERIAISTLDGDDDLSVDGTAGFLPAPLSIDGGGPTASDTLIITTIAGATTVRPGSTPDSGVIQTGLDITAFTGIETINLIGPSPAAAATLQINGTLGSDLLKLLSGPAVNLALVNDRAPINFTGFETVFLNGISGSDVYDVSPFGMTGVTDIQVHGQGRGGTADVIVNGSWMDDSIAVTVTSTSGATVTVGTAAPVTVESSTSLTVTGLAGNDTFTVGGPALSAPITLDGGAGNDTFNIGGYSSAVILSGGTGSDTVDFSRAQAGVTMDLDLLGAPQNVNDSGLTVKLVDAIENFVGSPANDQVYADALPVARSIDGNDPTIPDAANIPPGDTLSFDGRGQFTTIDRTLWGQPTADSGTASASGLQPVTFISIETLDVTNSRSQTGFAAYGPSAYTPAVDYPMLGTMPTAIALGDVDGDGYQDMVTVNSSGAGILSVRLGNGNGTFQDPVGYAVGLKNLYDVRLVDMDGDGDLDVVTAGKVNNKSAKNSVAVLFNNGDGTFSDPSITATGLKGSLVALSVGDVDGDGATDVLLGTKNQLMMLMNDGSGSLTPHAALTSGGKAIRSVSLVDVTGDDSLDILALSYKANSFSVFVNDESGLFTSTPTGTYTTGKAGTGPTSMVVADFNADGALDVAVSNAKRNSISVILGNGDGTFNTQQIQAWYAPKGMGFFAIAAGDVNGDGRQDLVIGHEGSSRLPHPQEYIDVLLGNGNGTFTAPFTFATGDLEPLQPASIALGDFNRDGGVDIAVVNSSKLSNSVSVLLKVRTV
jgi:hypothetical protein